MKNQGLPAPPVRIPPLVVRDADWTLQTAWERTERQTIERALARTHGNVAEAAARLGILRTSLYRIMKRCGIATPSRAGN
jgi:transcriptional regulator of acetoin/glycerol metabolism